MGLIKLLMLCLCLCVYAQEINDNERTDIMDNDRHSPRAPLGANINSFTENHKPLFKNCGSYFPEVEEGQDRLTWVIRVQAEDNDDGNAGKIIYSLEEVWGSRQLFVINGTTGDIYTNTPFDRDEPAGQKEFYVSVKATDDGRPPLADICTFKVSVLDINDNTPSFDREEYHYQVSEDLPENSEVLRVLAYDLDDGENSRLTYSFGTFEEYFRINAETGVVYLKKRLNDKRGEQISATVVVKDNGKNPNSATVEISFVVDSKKKHPRILEYTQQIFILESENDFEKTLVNLKAESNSADNSVAFELVKGSSIGTNKEGTFALRPTGDNSALIRLARPLDYESVTQYQLTVRAQNEHSLYASVNIIVNVGDVNDEIPTFIEVLKGSVVENDVPGAHAMTVRAIDNDGTSPNNKVEYELISHNNFFEIERDSGIITAKVSFDREEKNLYHVTVQARDSAPSALFREPKPNSANQTFFISIEDQNDNKPLFTEAIYIVYNISESADTQKDVVEVKAVDKDTASLIEYSIIEGNEDEDFYIEKTTGRIKVNKNLDFEKIESYSLTVLAFDGIYNDTTKVIIHIQNENDEPPIFEAYTKEIHFKEETVSDDCIITLRAFDPDIKDRNADQKIIYNIRGTYKSLLSVTASGCVTLIKPLDRDLPNGARSYQAYINAVDNNGEPNSLNTFAEITIRIE